MASAILPTWHIPRAFLNHSLAWPCNKERARIGCCVAQEDAAFAAIWITLIKGSVTSSRRHASIHCPHVHEDKPPADHVTASLPPSHLRSGVVAGRLHAVSPPPTLACREELSIKSVVRDCPWRRRH